MTVKLVEMAELPIQSDRNETNPITYRYFDDFVLEEDMNKVIDNLNLT